jgi:hypothetical protein
MLYPVTSIRFCASGNFYRIRYRSNRAVDVQIPDEHRPELKFNSTFEFDEFASDCVKQAIDQHEESLIENQRLG